MKTWDDLNLIDGMPSEIGGAMVLAASVDPAVEWLASQAWVEDFLVSTALAQASAGVPNAYPGRLNVTATNFIAEWDATTATYTLKIYGEA